jgi:hypothetical protein
MYCLQAHWSLPWREAVELATAAALAAVLSNEQLSSATTAGSSSINSSSSSSSSSSEQAITAVSTDAVRVLQALNRVRYNSFALTAVIAASHPATGGTAVDTQVSFRRATFWCIQWMNSNGL